jgi:hypothetical protein
MNVADAWPQVIHFFGTPLVLEPSQGQLSSDAGLLPIRQFDERVRRPRAFAEAVDGPRAPASQSAASPRGPGPASLVSSSAARTGTATATDWTPEQRTFAGSGVKEQE